MEPAVIVGWVQALIFAVQTLILAGTIIVIAKQISTARNSQRAWVMVDVGPDLAKWADGELHMLEGSDTEGDSTTLYAVLVCKNEGSSPGWIDEERVKFEIVASLPPKPNFESAQFVKTGPIPIGTGKAEGSPVEPIAIGHPEQGKMAIIYGIVKYRDIFNKPRETTFAYTVHNKGLRRLEGYPKYNKHA